MKYTCKCCKFESRLKQDYIKHITSQKHINNYRTNKYCDICEKEYSSINSFKLHTTTYHPDIIDGLKNKNKSIKTIKSKSREKPHNESTEISYTKI